MKIKQISILLSVFIMISACSSPLKVINQNIHVILFNQIEEVKIGQSKTEVIKLIGEPLTNDTWHSYGKIFESLEYVNRDEFRSQRATILLDPYTKKVISKTFIPNEGELEKSIEYFTNLKYKSFKFTKLQRPRCNLHFTPSDVMLVSFEVGILIDYFKNDSGVMAISWMSKEDLADTIDKINKCIK